MKWQAITIPDSLVSLLTRPWARPANDWTMLHESGVLDDCCRVYSSRPRLYIYRDPAYNNAFGIIALYEHAGS